MCRSPGPGALRNGRGTMRTTARARTLRSIAVLAVGVAITVPACGGGGHHGGPPFTLAGTMVATAGSAIDSDTNDRNAPFARNDSAAQAQAIGNPVTLGGHLNRPGFGPPGATPGQTTFSGDMADWFRVSI